MGKYETPVGNMGKVDKVIDCLYSSPRLIRPPRKSDLIREVFSFEVDNLEVFYYLIASNIWAEKRRFLFTYRNLLTNTTYLVWHISLITFTRSKVKTFLQQLNVGFLNIKNCILKLFWRNFHQNKIWALRECVKIVTW